MDLITLLPPDVAQAIVAAVAAITALRVLAIALQKLAARTAGAADDAIARRIAAALGVLERAFDWVSVGPTGRR